jgi:hypothetical protein
LFWEHNRTNPLQKGTNTYVIFLIPCKGPMYTFYGNTGWEPYMFNFSFKKLTWSEMEQIIFVNFSRASSFDYILI